MRAKKNIFRVTTFSRRQFLQRVGITAGGTVIATISLASACKSSGNTTVGTTTEANTTGATTPATGTPITTSFSYVPPTVLPPLIDIPGTNCQVADDGRLYSTDHIWVKPLSTNLVVMGITIILVKILYEPYSLSLPEVGSTLACGDFFGTIEGYKMMADLPSPVSGVVTGVNKDIARQGAPGQYITAINLDPYRSGWMFVVQLSKPEEINDLLTPQAYSLRVKPEE